MNLLIRLEKWCLWGHILSMAFGLAGILWVTPHPEILEYLPAGAKLYSWSLAGGGVAYILMGLVAVSIFCYRTIGTNALLAFLIPAISVSLSCELLGTSTGLPFGDYSYLNGLGYKIGGLVPFTIPLSWFYLGICCYLLARGGFLSKRKSSLWQLLALATGALLLMSWDFVLDPAMSQTAMPFWYWHTPGAFFGMPYQNFAGWFFTGLAFMATAAAFWRDNQRVNGLSRSELTVPLIVYIANFSFAMLMSLGNGIYIPVLLGLILGLLPAVMCWLTAPVGRESVAQVPLRAAVEMTAVGASES